MLELGACFAAHQWVPATITQPPASTRPLHALLLSCWRLTVPIIEVLLFIRGTDGVPVSQRTDRHQSVRPAQSSPNFFSYLADEYMARRLYIA